MLRYLREGDLSEASIKHVDMSVLSQVKAHLTYLLLPIPEPLAARFPSLKLASASESAAFFNSNTGRLSSRVGHGNAVFMEVPKPFVLTSFAVRIISWPLYAVGLTYYLANGRTEMLILQFDGKVTLKSGGNKELHDYKIYTAEGGEVRVRFDPKTREVRFAINEHEYGVAYTLPRVFYDMQAVFCLGQTSVLELETTFAY